MARGRHGAKRGWVRSARSTAAQGALRSHVMLVDAIVWLGQPFHAMMMHGRDTHRIRS